jgi:hypothetical protein
LFMDCFVPLPEFSRAKKRRYVDSALAPISELQHHSKVPVP